MTTQERWLQLSFAQQMGNIGSEVSRARHWENEKDIESRNCCLKRVLHDLDLTITQEKQICRCRELLRFRETIGDWYCGLTFFKISLEELEKYCFAFALKARRK